MPRQRPEYACSKCGATPGRANLRDKRVVFKEIGKGGRQIRSRSVAWLCITCTAEDPDFDRPAYAAAPGNADTAGSKEFRDG